MLSGEDCQLTIVVPAYNEADRIVESLRRIDAYLTSRALSAEVVVVDDGSTDDTADVVRRLAGALRARVRVVASRPNRGKGYAVRLGIAQARGAAMLVTDADLSTPIEELDKFLPPLQNGIQVAIGSRHLAGSVIEERQPILRETMGRVFKVVTRLLVVRVSDVTCGFKCFSRAAATEIFSRVTLDDWSFDAEVLFLARRLGLSIAEIPVHWRDVAGTKVHRGRDALRSALGLVRIFANAARGRYRLDERA